MLFSNFLPLLAARGVCNPDPTKLCKCLCTGRCFRGLYNNSSLASAKTSCLNVGKQGHSSFRKSIAEEADDLIYCTLDDSCSFVRSSSAWQGYLHHPTDGRWQQSTANLVTVKSIQWKTPHSRCMRWIPPHMGLRACMRYCVCLYL